MHAAKTLIPSLSTKQVRALCLNKEICFLKKPSRRRGKSEKTSPPLVTCTKGKEKKKKSVLTYLRSRRCEELTGIRKRADGVVEKGDGKIESFLLPQIFSLPC